LDFFQSLFFWNRAYMATRGVCRLLASLRLPWRYGTVITGDLFDKAD